MESTHAAAAWSVDSLPECATGPGDGSAEQELVVQNLAGLSEVAPELGIILTAEKANRTALHRMNFVTVKYIGRYSLDELRSRTCPSQARAMLIVHEGLSLQEQVLQGIHALSRNATAPAILVVLLTRLDDGCSEAGGTLQELAETRATCLKSGADDVISLGSGQKLSGRHIIESIDRAEIQAQKMSKLERKATEIQEEATNEVNATKDMLQRKLQVAWRKMMWHLPGRLLESIPGEDRSLQEQLNPDGACIGVGEYTFMERLGQGAYGQVYKATDGTGAAVAVKVIRKSSLRKVAQVLSLEQEACLMQHLPPHPNVLRARAALHGPKNLYLVMEYTGSVDLHQYIQVQIARAGCSALEASIADCFMAQMAAAVAHLHGVAVCHRDIKPCTFIVSEGGEKVSLQDFGLAAMLCSPTQRLTQCCGSLPFVAPEVLQQQADVGGQSYDPFAADIWSLAMNFIEIRKGPYIIEKLLGWVPQHPTGLAQRLEGVKRFPALFAGLPDANMMHGTVGRMLQLQPEDRISITEVIHSSGLGYSTPIAPAPASTCMTVPMRAPLPVGTGALCARVVECEEEDLYRGTLLERLGGENVIRVAVDNMFDLAITNSPLTLLLDLRMGGMPAVRGLYADEVAEYFDCEPGCARAEGSMQRMREAHMHLTMSDSDFDVLVEHFGAALSGNGVCEGIVCQACARFAQLREAVTTNFHSGAVAARRCGAAASRAAAAADGEERAQRFAEVLACHLAQHSSLGSGARAVLREEALSEHFLGYLRGEEGYLSPLNLQGLQLNLAQTALVVNTARTAFVEAGWQPEEVRCLYFSLREEWDRIRLIRLLRKVHSFYLPVDSVAWTTITLGALQAAQCSPSLAGVYRHEALIELVAVIGTILLEGTWEEHDDHLGVLGSTLNLSHAAFDAVVELFRGACARVVPLLHNQVALVVLGLRPWVMVRRDVGASPDSASSSSA